MTDSILSKKTRKEIDIWLKKYPADKKQSAVLAALYSMFETKPVGKRSISICNNISCMLMGAENIVEHVENKLGVKTGESTKDGKFFLKREEECLAACCGGPMMMIDHIYYENLTTEKVDEILESLD